MPRKKTYKNRYVQSLVDGKCALLYVKLPAYIRVWYAAKYGVPVVLDATSSARVEMHRSIRSTNRQAYFDTSTMSKNLWDVAVKDPSFDQSQWLAFALPDKVIRDGCIVDVDNSWDVYYTDVRIFKNELAGEFWNCVCEYISDQQIDDKMNGRLYRADWTLQRFCAEYGIQIEYFEQVRRQYYRFLKARKEIERETREAVLRQRDENLDTIRERVRFQYLNFLDDE